MTSSWTSCSCTVSSAGGSGTSGSNLTMLCNSAVATWRTQPLHSIPPLLTPPSSTVEFASPSSAALLPPDSAQQPLPSLDLSTPTVVHGGEAGPRRAWWKPWTWMRRATEDQFLVVPPEHSVPHPEDIDDAGPEIDAAAVEAAKVSRRLACAAQPLPTRSDAAGRSRMGGKWRHAFGKGSQSRHSVSMFRCSVLFFSDISSQHGHQ
jgi:hypothetical protein